jgi:tetratricopeptide (TPR) repeat protein
MSKNDPSPDLRPDSPAGERLDSWKEIASYLKRSVRSVQRWEAEEGMPVHRHLHDKRGTIYGFKAELDAWWKERGAILADRNGAEKSAVPSLESGAIDAVSIDQPPGIDSVVSASSRPHSAALIGAGFALAVGLLVLVAWLSRNGGTSSISSRPLSFKPREWVLVANFENRTGEKLFDGTLDYALRRELSNSRHVNVVSRERISDTLRLMRKPLDSRLEAPLAREVCLRDGGIRALLTGRVEKVGSTYAFSVALMEPRQGTLVAGFNEQSSGTDGALSAIRRISNRVRAALGENPVPETDEKVGLAKVTTSSLRALQLYSRADSLMGTVNDSQSGAEELLRQAVSEDPNFASAYILLAHAINNQDRAPEEFLPHVETAFRLSETTSDRERYFIRASYYYFHGQRDKAIAAYEALLGLYPDHGWAAGNLVALYELPEDLDKVVLVEARLADAHPRSFGFNWHAGYNFVAWKRDPLRARPYLRRCAELVTPEITDEFRWAVSWVELLPFTEQWLEGDLDRASAEVDRVAVKLDTLARNSRDVFAVKTALAYLTLGRIRAAEDVSEKIFDPVIQNDMRAQISFLKGDPVTLTEHLRFPGDRKLDLSPGWRETMAILQARGGDLPGARRYLVAEREQDSAGGWRGRLKAVSRPQERPELHTVPGEIALARGDLAGSIRELEEATGLAPEWGRDKPAFLLGSETLASALAKKGDLKRAVQVLERAGKRRFQAVINNNSGPYWLRSRIGLATLYRQVGRVEDARTIESDLRKLLARADADHPILVELKARASS